MIKKTSLRVLTDNNSVKNPKVSTQKKNKEVKQPELFDSEAYKQSETDKEKLTILRFPPPYSEFPELEYRIRHNELNEFLPGIYNYAEASELKSKLQDFCWKKNSRQKLSDHKQLRRKMAQIVHHPLIEEVAEC